MLYKVTHTPSLRISIVYDLLHISHHLRDIFTDSSENIRWKYLHTVLVTKPIKQVGLLTLRAAMSL